MNPELIARTNGDSQHDPRNLSTLVEGTIEPWQPKVSPRRAERRTGFQPTSPFRLHPLRLPRLPQPPPRPQPRPQPQPRPRLGDDSISTGTASPRTASIPRTHAAAATTTSAACSRKSPRTTSA